MKAFRTFVLAVAMIAGVAVALPANAATAVPDPTKPGPFQVERATYNLGETAYKVAGFPGPIELQGVVHYPKNPQGKKLPLIIFMHGRHATCGTPDGNYELGWPCVEPAKSIPSYLGYEYVGKVLASHGYVVASIGANGINAVDNETEDFGMHARGMTIQRHIDLWRMWNGAGGAPFGDRFKGAIDLQRVATMGHSRGGEGVVNNLGVNAQASKPVGIKAVLPLAPVDFEHKLAAKVPLGVILPTCDGDVFDLQGVRFYDDSRYAILNDPAPKHVATVAGANHNFFNTVWSPSSGQPAAWDDWQGTGGVCERGRESRLNESRQRAVGLAYMASFFRYYVGGESAFGPLWKGETGPPQAVGFANVAMSYHAPVRRDVNRLQKTDDLTTNTAGGKVTSSGFSLKPYLCGGQDVVFSCLVGEYKGAAELEPHVDSWATMGTPILQFGWSNARGALVNELPAGKRDVREFATLRFRAATNFSSDTNFGVKEQRLHVTLVDGKGRTAKVDTAKYGSALTYPPQLQYLYFDGIPYKSTRRYLLGQVRIPLTDFSGIDLADVRSVRIDADLLRHGMAGINDLAFSD